MSDLLPFPTPNPGFREVQEVVFLVPSGGPWSLVIDDVELQLEGSGWSWAPSFFAGPVVATLKGPVGETRWMLDVAPDPMKLGRDRFTELLRELSTLEPSLVPGAEASTTAIGYGDLDLEDELATLLSLSRLRTWGEELLRATEVIERQPRRVLRRRTESVALHRARRLSDMAMSRLLRSNKLQVIGERRLIAEPGTLVEVEHTEETVDSPANRAVVELLVAVLRRVEETRTALEQRTRGGLEDEDVKAAVLRLPTRLQALGKLREGIKTRLRAWPWREVSRHSRSAAGSTALAADPSYARLAAMAWACLRTGLSFNGQESFSLSPTWQLFERWCFARLAQQLKGRWPQFEWKRERGSKARISVVGTANDREVELHLQPQFAAWDISAHDACRSLSRTREPDLVIVVRHAGEERWLVLDAKYRVTRGNVLEAMESAHIYRDSLRVRGSSPVASYLLIPARGGAEWLHDSAFQSEHGVGALVFAGALPESVFRLLGEEWALPG